MRKRFLSVLLSLVLAFSMMPIAGMTAYATAANENKLYVDGVNLVEDADHRITCSGGGTAEYNPNTQTLTLTNAKITGHTSQAMAVAGIYISDFNSDVRINLVGKNSITLTDTSLNNSGIFMRSSDNKAKLLIDGTGSLDIKLYGEDTSVGLNNTNSDIKVGAVSLSFENASTTKIIHTMFHTNASIVLDGTTITSTGGYLTGITTPDDESKNSITIKDAEIDLKNTEGGIYTGNLTITNSKVTTYGDELATICCWGNISITDSTVYANTKEDFGIYCFGTAAFSGGKATVISQESDGMKATNGLVIKNGAEVSVTSNEYTAVFTEETVNIENGKLTATGGENGYAILARRCVNSPSQSKPTDSKTTIVFGKDIMEVNGAIIETDDWDYTTVWDDWEEDEVDYWMTQSYFTDGEGNVLSRAVIETAFVVTYTDGKNGERFADQSYIVPSGGSTPAFVGDLSDVSGWTLEGWKPLVASTVTGTATYTAQWKETDPNNKPPQTGDNSHIALWFALLTVSGGLLAATACRRKKKDSVK